MLYVFCYSFDILLFLVRLSSDVITQSKQTAADEEKKRAVAEEMEKKQLEEAKRLSLLMIQQQQKRPDRQLTVPSQYPPYAQYPYAAMQMQPTVRGKAERQDEYNERVALKVSDLMTEGTPTTKTAANQVLSHLCDTKMNPTNLVVKGASALETPAIGESPNTATLLVNRMKENSLNN